MKVALIGYAIENQAALRYWQAKGADVTVCDRNPDIELPDGVTGRLSDGYLDGLDEFDVIVRTVGMHPRLITEANPAAANKITTAVNLFFQDCSKPIIGVTGTKGKGTTSTLITKMLEAAGKKVLLGGNIGVPVLDLLPQVPEADYVVLELSSFQLIDCQHSPHIGVCLMVVPEHLDWHADVEEYYNAKKNLFAHQTADDVAIYYGPNHNSANIAGVSAGKVTPYFTAPGAIVSGGQVSIDGQVICSTEEIKLPGEHNWQNVCAAVTAAWQVTQDVAAMKQVISTFAGLEHRLELVREVNGIKYYDDSFGTTPETAIVAVQAFDQPKVVILGGSDKEAAFDELGKVVATNNVKSVVLIGDTAPKIRQSLSAAGYDKIIDGGTTMASIMQAVQSVAAPGDIVLLSTGCASFGLFKNYKDRGEQFKQAVQSLA